MHLSYTKPTSVSSGTLAVGGVGGAASVTAASCSASASASSRDSCTWNHRSPDTAVGRDSGKVQQQKLGIQQTEANTNMLTPPQQIHMLYLAH